MLPGEQIAYIPSHLIEINGSAVHLLQVGWPGVEYGFVTGHQKAGSEEVHFCRYWRQGHPGELRTRANSEATPTDCLYAWKSVGQGLVDQLMQELYPSP